GGIRNECSGRSIRADEDSTARSVPWGTDIVYRQYSLSELINQIELGPVRGCEGQAGHRPQVMILNLPILKPTRPSTGDTGATPAYMHHSGAISRLEVIRPPGVFGIVEDAHLRYRILSYSPSPLDGKHHGVTGAATPVDMR